MTVMLEKNEAGQEVIEIPAAPAAPAAEVKPTVEDLQQSGLSQTEIEAAQKHGMVAKPEDKKPDPKQPDPKKAAPAAKKPGEGQDFGVEDDPAKEQERIAAYNENEKGLYWSQKKERIKRQKAEDRASTLESQLKATQQRVADLEKAMAKPSAPAKPGETVEDDEIEKLLEGEEGKDGKDGKKKPLTREDLDAIEKEKEEAHAKEETARQEKARTVQLKLKEFEVAAQSTYSDFDEVMNFTEQLLKATSTAGEMEKLFPEAGQRKKVEGRIRNFLLMTFNADEFEEGDYNPADAGYDLGKLHPEFSAGGGGKTAKKGEGLDPEKVKKIAENASGRPSAAVPGGSGRKISVSELTPEEAAKLPQDQWARLPKKERERLLREA